MDNYPLKNKLKELLRAKGEKTGWLAGEIGRSPRWVELITTIDDVTIGMLEKLSAALEFDIIADYRQWTGKDIPQLHVLNEARSEYKRAGADDITLNITVRGNIKNASKVLATIKQESEKQGYKID